jgi:hypothetical protein
LSIKFLILTVFLTIGQAASPIPRQAPNGPTNTSGDVQNQTKTENKPADLPSPPVNQNQTKTPETHGNKQGNNNTEQPVTVGKLPSVSITKDWTDRFYWLFSGLLVVIGGFQIWLLVRQLDTINRQADIAEQQKNQMIQAGEQTERIIAQMKETEVRDLRAYVGVSKVILSLEKPDVPRGIVEVKNFGKTPAYKVRQWIGIAPQSHPLTVILPESSSPETASVSVIFPDITTVSITDFKKPLPLDAVIGTAQLTIYVYGRITYEDIFKNEWHSNYRFIFGGPEGGKVYRNERNVIFGTMGPDSEGNEAT